MTDSTVGKRTSLFMSREIRYCGVMGCLSINKEFEHINK